MVGGLGVRIRKLGVVGMKRRGNGGAMEAPGKRRTGEARRGRD